MSNRRDLSSKRRSTELFCERYVCYWMFVSLAACFLVGWPVIISWVGLAWGMHVFLKIFFGSQDSDHSQRKQ